MSRSIELIEHHIVIGLIFDVHRQILVAQRQKSQHLADLWEFPGGKIEPGESAEIALKRELFEELNIEVQKAIPFLKITHSYPTKTVHLDVWQVLAFKGLPIGKEGQPIRWLQREQLRQLQFPEANKVIIDHLTMSG